jgi:hypothetical protein
MVDKYENLIHEIIIKPRLHIVFRESIEDKSYEKRLEYNAACEEIERVYGNYDIVTERFLQMENELKSLDKEHCNYKSKQEEVALLKAEDAFMRLIRDHGKEYGFNPERQYISEIRFI